MTPIAVFINYRRRDTRHVAGRLRDQIVNRFGEDSVFVDVESILPGQDYVTAIDGAVSRCDYMLVLIGEDWLTPDDGGARRIDDPNDRLRLEIEAGLRHQTMVIPVLVDAARMPKSRELPASLVPLSRHQAVHLRHDSFPGDARYLLDALDPEHAASPPTQPGPGAPAAKDGETEIETKAESKVERTARWLSFALLVVVLLRLVLTASSESVYVESARGLSSGLATLVWLLPALPVALAAILTASRGSAGAALGSVLGGLFWVWTTAVFNVDAGDSPAPHMLLGLMLVGAAVGIVVARPGLRHPVTANSAAAALAGILFLVLAVAGRGLSRLVGSVAAGDSIPRDLLTTPGAGPAVVIPVLLAGTAVLLRMGPSQARALLVAAWLQVLYPLVVRALGFPDVVRSGTAVLKGVDAIVFLAGSYCIVLAVRASQRRALREPE
jgi:hypothetical protein